TFFMTSANLVMKSGILNIDLIIHVTMRRHKNRMTLPKGLQNRSGLVHNCPTVERFGATDIVHSASIVDLWVSAARSPR
ncbi:hypothetical protein, partial [Rubrimonas sp.]|uniref:hypothetical protein n=1 Tax=Rubrimonas sp. TaxID=2036015 RepID=UPI002FDD8B1B